MGTTAPVPAASGKPAPAPRVSSQRVHAADAAAPRSDDEIGGDLADSAPAIAIATNALPSNTNPDDTNVWPDENAEAAFIAETRGRGEPPVAAAPAAEEDEDRAPKVLPPLSELVERIPVETRELMDELFRTKFVAVRKVKKSALKPNP